MKPIDDLLRAFEVYYTIGDRPLAYSTAQRMELHNAFVWIGPEYERELYGEVIRTHPTSLRSLPDVAIVTAAANKLNPPGSYAPPPKQIEDQTQPTFDEVKQRLDSIHKEVNKEERQAMRRKRERGECSLYQLWWLECIDTTPPGEALVYRAMPQSFRDKHAEVRQW
jgi:hypothetical protein